MLLKKGLKTTIIAILATASHLSLSNKKAKETKSTIYKRTVNSFGH